MVIPVGYNFIMSIVYVELHRRSHVYFGIAVFAIAINGHVVLRHGGVHSFPSSLLQELMLSTLFWLRHKRRTSSPGTCELHRRNIASRRSFCSILPPARLRSLLLNTSYREYFKSTIECLCCCFFISSKDMFYDLFLYGPYFHPFGNRNEGTQVGQKRKCAPSIHEEFCEGHDNDDVASALLARPTKAHGASGRNEGSRPEAYDQGPESEKAR